MLTRNYTERAPLQVSVHQRSYGKQRRIAYLLECAVIRSRHCVHLRSVRGEAIRNAETRLLSHSPLTNVPRSSPRGPGKLGMFALVVLGFLVAYLLVLRGMRKPAIALALVLQLACLGLYFSHSYHVNWPW